MLIYRLHTPRITPNSLQPEPLGPQRHILYVYTGNSGVVVEELTFRKQEFNFTLEDTVGGSGGESVVLLQRDFRLGKQ